MVIIGTNLNAGKSKIDSGLIADETVYCSLSYIAYSTYPTLTKF